MICFMAIPNLRKLGKQAELKLFNKKVEELGYNSVEVLLASLFYRFILDDRCAMLIIRKPTVGDEPFEGLKFTKGISTKRCDTIFNDMANLAWGTFGVSGVGVKIYNSTRITVYIKCDAERGDWDGYEYELTGKDGISIPAKFARGSR